MEDEELVLTPDNKEQRTKEQISKEQQDLKQLQQEIKAVIPETDMTKGTDEMTPETFGSMMVESLTIPAKAEALETKEEFWNTWGQKYIQQFDGDETKAKNEASKVYSIISQKYQDMAFQEHETLVLENMEYMMRGLPGVVTVGENYIPDVVLGKQTLSGASEIFDRWSGPIRDERTVMMDNKKVIAKDGSILEFKEDPYELTYEDEYADDEGNRIVGFVYEKVDPYSRDYSAAKIRAIYEGERPDPEKELVSRLDAYDTFLKSNTLDTSTWKVAIGSVTDFVIDVFDTALAFSENFSNFMTLGLYDYYGVGDWNKDVRTYLQSWMMSKSKYDKEHMISVNNAVNLGINIGAQLLMGKGLATAGSKIMGIGVKMAEEINASQEALTLLEKQLVKATSKIKQKGIIEKIFEEKSKLVKLSKTYNKRANVVKGFTLGVLGAMQAKATSDEALGLGFSPYESSWIFFGSLATMAWVNSISDLGFEKLGLNNINGLLKANAKAALTGIKPGTEGVKKVFANFGKIYSNSAKSISKALKNAGPVWSSVGHEAIEEESEFVLDQLVRHVANGYANLRYKEKAPHFKSAADPGYWEYFMNESIMNMVGGALGGFMSGSASALYSKFKGRKTGTSENEKESINQVNEQELLIKGETANNWKRIGFQASRTKEGLRWFNKTHEYLDDMMKKGMFGRDDLSNLWVDEENRFKLTKELTEDERSRGYMSQAMFHYLAAKGQLDYYRIKYQNTDKTIEEIVQEDDEFDFLLKSPTLFEESRKLFDRKGELYYKANTPGGISIDKELKALRKEKDKIKITKEGVVEGNEEYQSKLEKLSNITGLTTAEVEELIDVNQHIEDIGNGNAIQIMFLKNEFSDKKYRHLNYDFFKNLIEADTKRQLVFKESNKKALEFQDNLSKHILNILKENSGMLNDDDIEWLLSEDANNILLTEEAKAELLTAIDKLGKPLSQKKADLISELLSKFEDSFTEGLSEPYLINIFGDKVKDISAVKAIEKLKALIAEYPDTFHQEILKYTEDDDLGKLLSLAIEDENKLNDLTTVIKNGDSKSRNLKFLEMLYIIKKTLIVGGSKDIKSLDLIKLDIDSVYSEQTKRDANNIAVQLLAMDDGEVRVLLNSNMLINGESSTASSITDIILTEEDKKAGVTFDEKIDPRHADKIRLVNKVLSTPTAYPESVNNDLLNGVIKTENGGVKASDRSLERQYEALLNSPATIRDSDGKIILFTDPELAQDLLDQVEIRLEENKFLLNSLGMLAKIETLHNTKLNNNNTSNTFLTTYLNNYFIKLENIDEDFDLAVQELKTNITALEDLKGKAEELVKSAADVDTKQKDVYVRNAIEMYAKSISHIGSIISDVATAKKVSKEFQSTIEEINKIINVLDLKESTIENLGALAEADYLIKKQLKALYDAAEKKGKKYLQEFIDKEIGMFYNPGVKTIFPEFVKAFMMPVDDIQSDMRAYHEDIAKAVEENDDELLTARLLTISQLQWIEDITTAATNPNYLKTLKNIYDPHYFQENLAVYSGALGTGKTRVVAGHAANTIYKILNKNTLKKEDILYPIFAAAKDKQSRALREAAEELNVKAGNINGTGKADINQYDLYELFKNSSVNDLHLTLKNAGVIFIDEISQLEFIGNVAELQKIGNDEDKMGVLNLILYKLSKVNKIRKTEGLPELMIIGTGDAEQPGYISGGKSPRLPDGSKGKMNINDERAHVFAVTASDKVYINSTRLDINFRTKILNLPKQLETLNTVLTSSYIGKVDKLAYPDFVWGKNGTVHQGTRIHRTTFKERLNDEDLVKDIEAQIEATKSKPDSDKFRVLLISGVSSFDKAILDNTLMGELYKKYPNSFTLNSFDEVQGDEANYAIINVDPDFFLGLTEKDVKEGTIKPEQVQHFRNRVDMLTMAMGRAYTFIDVALDTDFSFTNGEPGDVKMESPNLSKSFKKQWLEILINQVLQSTTGETETAETETAETEEKETEETEEAPEETEEETEETEKTEEETEETEETEKTEETEETEETELPKSERKESITKVDEEDGIQHGDLINPGENGEVTTSSALAIDSDVVSDVNKILDKLPNSTVSALPNKSNIEFIIRELEKLIPGSDAKDAASIQLAIDQLKALVPSLLNNPSAKDSEIESALSKELEDPEKAMDKPLDRDYMIMAEKDKQKMVMYGNLDKTGSDAEHVETYKTIMHNLYNRKDHYNPVSDAIYYDGTDTIINSDKYDFFIVSYADPKADKETFFLHHVLIAKEKTGTKEEHIIAQLPDVENYTSDSVIGKYFSERANFILKNKDSENSAVKKRDVIYTIDGGRSFEKTVYYIESRVALPSTLINGLTVGNVLEHSYNIKQAMQKLDIGKDKIKSWEDIKIARVTRKNISNDKYIKRLRNVRPYNKEKNSRIWNVEALQNSLDNVDLPFGKITDKGIVIKYNGGIFVIVKTSKGKILYKKKGLQWIPVTGAIDGVPVISVPLTLPSPNNKDYDAELSSISYNLIGLKNALIEENFVEQDTDTFIRTLEDLGYTNIKSTKGVSDVVYEIQLLREFKDKSNNYLGNIAISFDEATRLWNEVGGPASHTIPKLIMRGDHAGKAVVFYTFREDINLNTMTNEEFNDFYLKMIKHKNENNSVFTDNASGIGMVLFDSKPKTLVQLAEKLKNYFDVTSADFNKVVLSKESEQLILGLFSELYTDLSENNPEIARSNIAIQLADRYGKPEFRDIIKAWYQTLDNNTKTAVKTILTRMFAPGNTGRITVSLNIDSNTKEFFDRIDSIYRSSLTEEEKADTIRKVHDEYKTRLDPSLANINTPADLLNFVLNENAEFTAGGFAVLNRKGKFILKKGIDTVVTAVDIQWANTRYGNKDAVPDPHFDLYRLLSTINKVTKEDNKTKSEAVKAFSSVLSSFDALLDMTGRFPKGLYASPLVSNFNTYIGDINNSSMFDELETTVKQIRRPSVTMNVNELVDPDVVESLEDLEAKETEANEAIKDPEKKLQSNNGTKDTQNKMQDYRDTIEKATMSSIKDVIENIKNDKVLNDTDKNTLIEDAIKKHHMLMTVSGKMTSEMYKSSKLSDYIPIIEQQDEQIISDLDVYMAVLSYISDATQRISVMETIAKSVFKYKSQVDIAINTAEILKEPTVGLAQLQNMLNKLKAKESLNNLQTLLLKVKADYINSGTANEMDLANIDTMIKLINTGEISTEEQLTNEENVIKTPKDLTNFYEKVNSELDIENKLSPEALSNFNSTINDLINNDLMTLEELTLISSASMQSLTEEKAELLEDKLSNGLSALNIDTDSKLEYTLFITSVQDLNEDIKCFTS